MCTVSILSTNDGYLIGGNRDELKSRKKAIPPTLKFSGGKKYLSPTDTKAGGTWIAVNELGFSICILNRYSGNFSQDLKDEDAESRGKIIPALIESKGIEEALDLFNSNINPQLYRPFTLLFIQKKNGVLAQRLDWNGKDVHLTEIKKAPALFVSSGRFQDEVSSVRQKIFEDYITQYPSDIELIKKIHSHKIPGNGALSFAMEQDIVQTVSCTIIECSKEISMHYTDGLPEESSVWSTFSL